MAVRKKSIKIPVNFGNVADVIDNNTTVLGTPTIYIPENSSGNPVIFSSVVLFIAAQDVSTATGATVTDFVTTATLSGAGDSVVTVSTTALANSGENWGGLFGPIDYTAYFNTNFGTVTSKTCQTQILINITTGTGTDSRGVYGYYEITYTYDDAAATRIKTICIPYESQLGTLTTTVNTTFCTLKQLTNTNGILNGYASPTVRYRWIEIKGNYNANNNTTDGALRYSFDGGATQNLPTREAGLGSDTYQIYLINSSGLTTTAAHTFALWSTLATRWANIIVNEWITYEYTVLGTTQVLNYVELPIEFNSPLTGTTSAVADRIKRTFTIQEPNTITLVKSAAELCYNTNASATVAFKAGSQATYRSYAQLSSVIAGMFSFQHGLDSDSGAGNAFTFARGENQLTFDIYRSVGAVYNITGIIKILYLSTVASHGIDSHSDTRWGLLKTFNFTTITDNINTDLFSIPDANYFIQGLGLENYFWLQATNNTFTQQAAVLSSEFEGGGWRELFVDQFLGDNEIGYSKWVVRLRPQFKKYPQDPDEIALNLTGSRSYRTTSTTAVRLGTTWSVTYHTITSTISGNITNSNGGTVSLYAYRSDTEELVGTTSRSGNGSYSFTVYNDVLTYYVVAYENNSYKGISKVDVPAADFNISLFAAAGGGGEFYF